MDCRIEKMTNFKIIGFKRKFNMETSFSEIPKFWDEVFGFYSKKLYAEQKSPENALERAFVENQIGIYGACFDAESGSFFDYMIAGPYCGGTVPDGLEVFEMTSASNIEWYSSDDEPFDKNHKCSVWIPVKRK